MDVSHLLYIEDLKIFLELKNISDCVRLFDSLGALLHCWCRDNGLDLNVGKCNIMSFTLKNDPLVFDYRLDSTSLFMPDTLSDLAIEFNSKLSFINPINNITTTYFKMYGFILRCGNNFTDKSTLHILYFCYIRSKLEYASVIWSPHCGI